MNPEVAVMIFVTACPFAWAIHFLRKTEYRKGQDDEDA